MSCTAFNLSKEIISTLWQRVMEFIHLKGHGFPVIKTTSCPSFSIKLPLRVVRSHQEEMKRFFLAMFSYNDLILLKDSKPIMYANKCIIEDEGPNYHSISFI